MHRLIFFLLFTVSFFSPDIVLAGNPNVVTGVFKVDGTCGQCKQRIEDAAYIKGVKFAEWNKETHDLTVKYDSTKTTADKILQSVAKAGHDAGDFKATNEDYTKLPSCCKYKSGIKKH